MGAPQQVPPDRESASQDLSLATFSALVSTTRAEFKEMQVRNMSSIAQPEMPDASESDRNQAGTSDFTLAALFWILWVH